MVERSNIVRLYLLLIQRPDHHSPAFPSLCDCITLPDSSAHDHDPILISTLHSSSRPCPPTTDHHILSNRLSSVCVPCHIVSVVSIACPLFSLLRTRLLPDRLPTQLSSDNTATSKSTRSASFTLCRSIGRSGNSRTSFSFDTCTSGRTW